MSQVTMVTFGVNLIDDVGKYAMLHVQISADIYICMRIIWPTGSFGPTGMERVYFQKAADFVGLRKLIRMKLFAFSQQDSTPTE